MNKKPRSSLAEEILVTELQFQGVEQNNKSPRDTTPPKPSPLLKDATPPPDNLPAIPESPKTPKSPVCLKVGERGRGKERDGGGTEIRLGREGVREIDGKREG